MDLEQLKALVAAVEARSISQAARDLHLTQPALSIKLKALEQELGVPLLMRTYDGVSPTPQGEVVYETATRILGLCASIARSVKGEDRHPELRVGATPILGGYVLPRAVGRFMARHEQVKVNLTVGLVSELLRQVHDGQLSMAFIENTMAIPDMVTQELGPDELRPVVAAAWPEQGPLNERAAFALPQVLCIPECGMRQVLDRYLRARGRSTSDLSVVAELDSLDAVKAVVEGGAGVAWVAPRVVRRELQVGTLRMLPVVGVEIPFSYVAVFREARELCPRCQHYLALVREHLRTHRRNGARAG